MASCCLCEVDLEPLQQATLSCGHKVCLHCCVDFLASNMSKTIPICSFGNCGAAIESISYERTEPPPRKRKMTYEQERSIITKIISIQKQEPENIPSGFVDHDGTIMGTTTALRQQRQQIVPDSSNQNPGTSLSSVVRRGQSVMRTTTETVKETTSAATTYSSQQQREALRTISCLFDHENSLPQPVVADILKLLYQFPKFASRKYIFHTPFYPQHRAATCLTIFILHSVGDDSLDRCIKLFPDHKRALQQTIRDLWKFNDVPKSTCSANYGVFKDDGGLIWLMKECQKHEIDPSHLISFFLNNQAILNKKGNPLSVVETFFDLFFNPRPAVNLDLQFDVTLIPCLIRCGDKLKLHSLTLTKMKEFDTPTTQNIIELINTQHCLQQLAIDGTFDFDEEWVSPFCDALAIHSFRLRTLNLTGGYINLSWRGLPFSQLVRKSSSLVNLNVIGVGRNQPLVPNQEKLRRLRSGHPNLRIIASDLSPCLVDICCFDAKPAMQKWSQCKNNWSASCKDQQLGIIDSESLVKAILDLQQLCPSECQCSLPKDIRILLKECCGFKSQDEPMIVLFNLIYSLLGKHLSLWS